ncbi:methyltransferase domain-containing protein [Pontixanthobacter gangjinensis]|uniref:Methyltransferase domain-containing protein n=2 Tax=Pontixanthobacter gangjinensis TaxID=1028742 RepID=A0A6I4SMW1_9SPHN|nr:methyltransferase domain-containing protein [Pontixanthobacter gangjinensis]
MQKTPPTIFSPKKRAGKWARAKQRLASRPCEKPFLLAELTDDIIERIQFMQVEPGSALVVGDWAEGLSRFLNAHGWAVATAELGKFEEEAPYPSSNYNLVVHLMGLGHVNDLPGALLHANAALAEGGIFFGAFPGAGSLPCMRQVAMAADGDRPSPRCHPLVDNQAAAALLQRARFKRQVVDSHTILARYQTFDKLVSDLRDHGLTSSLMTTAPPYNKTRLALALDQFEKLKDQDGRVVENFELLTLTGWK